MIAFFALKKNSEKRKKYNFHFDNHKKKLINFFPVTFAKYILKIK